jgi:tripartite ATP-independent transporter DctP family solute receptor
MRTHTDIKKMKRRQFLKLSLATGSVAVFGLAGVPVLAQTRTLRFGSPMPVGSIYDQAMNMFAGEVAKLSSKKMKIETYPASQLGSIKEMLTSVQTGSLGFTIAVPAWYSSFVKQMDVFALPYLVHSLGRLRQALDGAVGEKVSKYAEAANLKLVGFWLMGSRHIVNNVRPIYKPADLAGLKIRVINSEVYRQAFRALGAITIALDPSEVYLALQQGVVDGFEYDLPSIVDYKVYEVSKYVCLDAHVTDFFIVSMNKRIWDSLAAEEQAILKQAMKTSMDWQWQEQPKVTARALETLKRYLKVNEITPEARAEFAKVTRPIYKNFEAQIGKDLIDLAIRDLSAQ